MASLGLKFKALVAFLDSIVLLTNSVSEFFEEKISFLSPKFLVFNSGYSTCSFFDSESGFLDSDFSFLDSQFTFLNSESEFLELKILVFNPVLEFLESDSEFLDSKCSFFVSESKLFGVARSLSTVAAKN